MSAKSMTENEKYLNEAQVLAHRFQAEREPETLREASLALINVNLAREEELKTRNNVRERSLLEWLHVLDLLDGALDPHFDPADVPEKLVQPPPSPGGEVLRPGADPSRIADPKARAEYEKAIAANREKAAHYRVQTHLRRLDEQLEAQAESFMRDAYSPVPSDQRELRTAIEQTIQNPSRKAKLLKVLKPPDPQ